MSNYQNRKIVLPEKINDHADPYAGAYQERSLIEFRKSEEERRKAPARIAACCLFTAAGCVLCGGATMFLINNPQIVDQALKIFNP